MAMEDSQHEVLPPILRSRGGTVNRHLERHF